MNGDKTQKTSTVKNPRKVTKEELISIDKRKVLETFVENDDALGLLLDFISTKHIQHPGLAGRATGMSG